jgi:N-acetylated-alpha-linked acidic dipeptidase
MLLLTAAVSLVTAFGAASDDGLEQWPAEARSRQSVIEQSLLDAVSPERLRSWHDRFCAQPHDTGTPGDLRMVDILANGFAEMGLEVEKQAFWAYLPRPVEAELQIISPDKQQLSIRERPIDRSSGLAGLTHGWNAYSGSGDVTGEVVYAHRGRKEDFERLEALGVDCTGRIVVARYGGNYRGYKAKFAEAAGAIGLIMFTDPADSGYGRGLEYPEGGYANGDYIQRGSIKTLTYNGDPLTPFIEATEDAKRLPIEGLALPTIPVQPVGWSSAQEILQRMNGASVPQDWQGGLPFRYRLTGGPSLTVRLKVVQERKIRKSFNVVGTIRGRSLPDELIVVGCHHDAWGIGAGDPLAGLITVMEAAQVIADQAKAGRGPERSIAFAGWGAEEYGIIGSVEWVEAHLENLKHNAVAYINLDMAAMGLRFRASASPTMQRVVAGAAHRVPVEHGKSELVINGWLERSPGADPTLPRFGNLGGGSDHVGFLALAGVPCISMGAGGSAGTSYHSNYDNLEWYRQVVGDDYEPGRLITRMAAVTASRLANSPLVAVDADLVGIATHQHLIALTTKGRSNGLFAAGSEPVALELLRVAAAARQFGDLAQGVQSRAVEAARSGRLTGPTLHRVNELLRSVDRAWLYESGLPGRPWFRNLFAAPDEDSGYAAWMLPELRRAVEYGDAAAVRAAEPHYLAVFERLNRTMLEIEQLVTAG